MTEYILALTKRIDHTILKADCTSAEIEQLCADAILHKFAAVCVPPFFVGKAAQLLENSPVKVATVIGYPMGFSTTFAKVEEIKRAIDEGVDELDVVVNICAVKNGNRNLVSSDINSCTSAAHMKGKTIKIIIETALLTQEEKLMLCEICTEQQVDYVKTSTGTKGGATIEDVKFLRANLPKTIKIKASGGIRSAEQALAMIKAGADRIGASAGVAITHELIANA